MHIYVLIHHINFWLYLYFLNILYFFKYSCTNIFHRRSLCTFYILWNGLRNLWSWYQQEFNQSLSVLTLRWVICHSLCMSCWLCLLTNNSRWSCGLCLLWLCQEHHCTSSGDVHIRLISRFRQNIEIWLKSPKMIRNPCFSTFPNCWTPTTLQNYQMALQWLKFKRTEQIHFVFCHKDILWSWE